jgi:hypothetical protein
MLYLLTSRIGTRLLHADEYTQGDNFLRYSHLLHTLLLLINHNFTALEIILTARRVFSKVFLEWSSPNDKSLSPIVISSVKASRSSGDKLEAHILRLFIIVKPL